MAILLRITIHPLSTDGAIVIWVFLLPLPKNRLHRAYTSPRGQSSWSSQPSYTMEYSGYSRTACLFNVNLFYKYRLHCWLFTFRDERKCGSRHTLHKKVDSPNGNQHYIMIPTCGKVRVSCCRKLLTGMAYRLSLANNWLPIFDQSRLPITNILSVLVLRYVIVGHLDSTRSPLRKNFDTDGTSPESASTLKHFHS